MATIGYYVSDYGYGHASRAVALIRELTSCDQELRIIVKGAGPIRFIRDSLKDPHVTILRNKPEPVITDLPGARGIHRRETIEEFRSWMTGWETAISEEEEFISGQGIDLVISDVPAHPVSAAVHTGVPGLVVSNFTWEGIYRRLLPGSAEVSLLFQAYREATLALVLPFEHGMEIFSRSLRVPMLVRTRTRSRAELRKKCGIGDEELLVYLGPGLSGRPPSSRKVRYLLSSRSPGAAEQGDCMIPEEETETQDWIGMCDLAVAKCGYSTVSEAVAARVPLVVWQRDGFAEDEAIGAKIGELGIGVVTSPADLMSCGLDDIIPLLPECRERFDSLPPQFTGTGARVIAGTVMEFLA